MIIIVALVAYIFYLHSKQNASEIYHHELIDSLEEKVENYEGCRTVSPYGDRPVRATFTDNRVAYVNFFHSSIPTIDAPLSDSYWQASLPLRTEEMFSSVMSSVLIELESVTLEHARTHRNEVESRIISRLQPLFVDHQYQLRQFNLLEFCEPFTVNTASEPSNQ